MWYLYKIPCRQNLSSNLQVDIIPSVTNAKVDKIPLKGMTGLI